MTVTSKETDSAVDVVTVIERNAACTFATVPYMATCDKFVQVELPSGRVIPVLVGILNRAAALPTSTFAITSELVKPVSVKLLPNATFVELVVIVLSAGTATVPT